MNKRANVTDDCSTITENAKGDQWRLCDIDLVHDEDEEAAYSKKKWYQSAERRPCEHDAAPRDRHKERGGGRS